MHLRLHGPSTKRIQVYILEMQSCRSIPRLSMKRRSPQFQFLAASPAPATQMDNRPLIGGFGNYGRRGYSSGSSDGRGRGHYVNGEPLYQSMREEDLGFRQGNNSGFEPSFLNPRAPPFYQNYGFRRPSLYSQRPQYWQPRPFVPNQELPPFDHNHGVRTTHQFRPRFPKPLDFRNWEYAKIPPPPDSERFTILSYNILADYLAINHRSKLYFHIPYYMMEWGWRKRNINFELGLWSADIMCFQEVDRFTDLEEELSVRGYNGIWKMRTGTPTDGCATFWHTSRFKLLHEESIEFNKLGLRDNVAQICVFELIKQNINENVAVAPTSLQRPNRVVTCNIHVLYNPKRGDIKLGQIRILLSKAHAVSKLWNDAPIVLCGDFNCTPKSALYNFISDRKLDISGLDRDKLSGQASAEIRATQPHRLNSRVEPGYNSTQLEDSKKVNCGDCLLDNKKNSGKRGNSLPSMINSLPTWSNCVQNVDTVPQDAVKAESQSYTTNACKHESDSSVCSLDESHREGSSSSFGEAKFPDRDNNLRKCSNSSNVEDKFSIHNTNDTVHEGIPSELIYADKFYTNLTEAKSGVTVDITDFSNTGDECFESNMDIVDEHLSEVRIHPETANSFTSTISSPEFSSQSSFSDHVKPSTSGRPQNLSSHLTNESEKGSSSTFCMDNASSASITIDFGVNEKLENSCLQKLISNPADEGIVEDDSTFFSALHNAEDPFSYELEADSTKDFGLVSHESLLHEPLQELNSETIYDPSLWTPMDVETATGSSDCTVLEHSLKLRSSYAEVEDFSGSRDKNGEPLVTSYNRCFLGTVDYIWRSEGLQTVKVLAPIPKHAMQWTPGFPTKKWGSDHIALVSELAFMNEAINKTES